jgi:uncharacterized protein (TIGR03435 family)
MSASRRSDETAAPDEARITHGPSESDRSCSVRGLCDSALATIAVDQTVIDRTGLDGVFDFELLFSRLPANERPDAPSIFTAVQEQLGLKLQPDRGVVPFVVIDSVHQPTPD